MRTAIDIVLVTLAFGAACLYAFLKLAPRDLRQRLGARLGKRAAAAAKSGSCGGCDDCAAPNGTGAGTAGTAGAAGASDEVRVAVADIPRRRAPSPVANRLPKV